MPSASHHSKSAKSVHALIYSHAMATQQTNYVLESEDEVSRLANQHEVIKDEMGSLVLAPIDLSKPMRILDSATADGA